MQWKNYSYDLTEQGAVITGYLSDETETSLLIPSQIEGHDVVEIGKEAFVEGGAFLERIEVPSTVKKIGDGAFKMCMALTDLILQNGVEEIGEEVLYLTPVDHLQIPESLRTIACPWEMGGIRFQISKDNPVFETDGYGLYQKNETAGSKEKELLVIFAPHVPEEYHVSEGTTVIGENAAAEHADLKRIILPDTVHTIREGAFEGCEYLEEIFLPEGLKTIETNAFSQCIRLASLHLPSTLRTLGAYAVSDTFSWSETLNGPRKITVEKGNPIFEDDGTSLYVKLPDGKRGLIRYLGQEHRYQIENDVEHIFFAAFRRAGLFRLDIPSSVKKVEENAFRECRNLHEIYLEESDTLLYIPGQPVYRKDEIMNLFGSKGSQTEKTEPYTEEEPLPEKWKTFVRDPIYSEPEHGQENPYEKYIFDYRGYDGLFHTYLDLPDQYSMAICRLKYPVLLGEEVRLKYRTFITDHLQEILESIAKLQDMEHLADLAELGFITEDNIETCMDAFSRPGCAAQMSYLLNYKQNHLAHTEFDFSL